MKRRFLILVSLILAAALMTVTVSADNTSAFEGEAGKACAFSIDVGTKEITNYELSGTLPAGLSDELTEASGKHLISISGTPSKAGSGSGTYSVNYADGTQEQFAFTISIGHAVYALTASDLEQQIPYEAYFKLPDGHAASVEDPGIEGLTLTVASDGRLCLSGTPTGFGDFTGKVSVVYSDQTTGKIDCQISVKQQYIVTEEAFEETLFKDVEGKITYQDGDFKSVKLSNGIIPDGMKLKTSAKGFTISGVPVTAGSFEFTLTMIKTDGSGEIQRSYKVTVSDAPSPIITKNPTGETVKEGGNASFIAHADFDSDRYWLFISPDNQSYQALEITDEFPMMTVSGAESETLKLTNIPGEFSGWSVLCVFEGPNGDTRSEPAVIIVQRSSISVPTIIRQPSNSEVAVGSTVFISVAATVDYGTLYYRWFTCSDMSGSDSEQIPDETENALSVTPDASGTSYYYVEVVASDGTLVSSTIRSTIVSVTAKNENDAPDTDDGGSDSQTESKKDTDKKDSGKASEKKNDNDRPTDTEGEKSTVVIVLLIFLAVVLIAALVIMCIMLYNRIKYDKTH